MLISLPASESVLMASDALPNASAFSNVMVFAMQPMSEPLSNTLFVSSLFGLVIKSDWNRKTAILFLSILMRYTHLRAEDLVGRLG